MRVATFTPLLLALSTAACGEPETAADPTAGAGTAGAGATSGVGGASASPGVGGAPAAGGAGASGLTGSGAAGGATPTEPREDGCLAPPPANYDPTLNYEWTAPAPDFEVTSAADRGAGSLRDILEVVQDGQVVGIAAALAGASVQLTEELYVGASITLDASAAPGFTLDGGGATRVLSIGKNQETTLVGLTIKNGYTTDVGGGVKVGQADEGFPQGKLLVRGCRFLNNTGLGGGGLIVGWRVDAEVEDSVFVGNDATIGQGEQFEKSGGAVATRQDAAIVIRRCAFRDNRGGTSGAVYNILEDITVEDSVFVDNHGDGSGAFFTDGGTIALRRTLMTGNTGTGDGGAMLIWAYDGYTTTMESLVILDSATTGQKGGAARIHAGGDLTLSRSVVARSSSVQQGGGLWIDGAGSVTIENTTFSENSVATDAGGGFTYNGTGQLTVSSCLFAHNSAGRAAAGFWKQPDAPAVVQNSIFAFNTTGESQDEVHLGPGPDDGGGNLEFQSTGADRGRAFADSTFADPLLGDFGEHNGTWLYPLNAESPAVGAAVSPTPALDQRGATRDAAPDIGPYEVNATCSP